MTFVNVVSSLGNGQRLICLLLPVLSESGKMVNMKKECKVVPDHTCLCWPHAGALKITFAVPTNKSFSDGYRGVQELLIKQKLRG